MYYNNPSVSILSNCGCPPPPCVSGECPIQLDFSCILYHKSNNQISALTNLGLTNGVTLQLFVETVDARFGKSVLNWSLDCLREDYTITDFETFGEAVDTQLCVLQENIDDLAELIVPLTANDSDTIDFTQSGVSNMTLTAVVKVSATANNQLSALADGLYSAPQTLSIDYVDGTISISDGNTVDFSSLINGASGFLGNVGADPGSPQDGQYWFRTDLAAAAGLKIRVNGATRTITTS
jgi:hypothetical protein